MELILVKSVLTHYLVFVIGLFVGGTWIYIQLIQTEEAINGND